MMEIIDNEAEKRFEAQVDGHIVRIEYIRTRDKIFLTHTEVPSALEGKGYGSRMVQGVLERIQQTSLKLVPLCPFVAAYLKRHPEWAPLLAEGYHI